MNEQQNETLALPVYPELIEQEVQYVVECIRDFFATHTAAEDNSAQRTSGLVGAQGRTGKE